MGCGAGGGEGEAESFRSGEAGFVTVGGVTEVDGEGEGDEAGVSGRIASRL